MLKLSPLPNCRLLISQRLDGDINNAPEAIRLITKTEHHDAQSLPQPICFFHHHHQANRHLIKNPLSSDVLEVWADSVISNQEAILAMKVADCFPIVLASKQKSVVSLIHAGWKPLLQNIIELTLMDIQIHFQVKPAQLNAWIGPGIGPCCYKFKNQPLQANLESWRGFVKETDEKWLIDLAGFASSELIRLGVKADSIIQLKACTSCLADSFFSHYATKIDSRPAGRMMVALLPETK